MRRLTTALLIGFGLGLMADTARAQPPFTRNVQSVLSAEDRGVGTVTTLTYTVAADADPMGDLAIHLDIPRDVDWRDSRNQVRIQLLDFDPVRDAWHQHGAMLWIGNPLDGFDTEFAVSIGGLCGPQVRAEIQVMRGMRVGATIGLREPVQ